MKGVDNSPANREGMTNKPIVTCAGDWNLFCTLEAPLVAAIPQDSCEWRRSYGRVTKSVYLEASFIKYNPDKVQSDLNLLNRPILHIYWTDCVDIEYYKTTLREDIEIWLKQLEKKGITDWMIILVETYDIRKTNKLLPRTTVLDKIKGDFAIKQTEDRFLSVINPIKSEARSAESWRALVAKMRHFVLVAYNKALIKFEEHMREQREKRNDPEWDFCKYFILQEQLAFVLEMLGLYEEALVQYDELDALFSQFVLNSNVTEGPKWLDTFKQPITSWQAVRLTALVPQHLRELIIKKKASLLDFRSYLFQRQSAMLLLMFKPCEIASRCLSTVHNTLVELSLLGCAGVDGAAACWAQLACAETLRACERLSQANREECAAMQAPLHNTAKDKLHELGKLCGLLPGSPEPTSEQLHLVVMLSAGMGDSEANNQHPTPTDRLKEALCSKTSFQQYYLELAELAMGTYKHIGRLRFARLIGRDLAAFYSELGETQKAVVFLMDALRSYEEQGWRDLAAQTRLELVAAAKKMDDVDRYTKLSATIACTAELEILVRNFYFEEMMKSIKSLSQKPEPVLTELNECFKIVSVALLPSDRGIYITDNKVQCRLVVESNMPKDITCTRAAISIERYKVDKQEKRTPAKSYKTDLSVNNNVGSQNSSPRKGAPEGDNELTNLITSIRLDDLKPKNLLLNPLHIISQLHYKEDKSLQKATVECINPKVTLKRSDSSKYRKPSATLRSNYEHSFTYDSFTLKPGTNEITLECISKTPGTFKIGQISLLVEEKLEFLSNVLTSLKVGYDVVTQGVNVYLNKVEPKKDLVAGLEHAMELVVTSGSSHIEENAKILLKTSLGLAIRLAEDAGDSGSVRELSIPVPASKPFETTRVPLRLFANLQPKKEKSLEHTVWLNCPWWEAAMEVPLHFSPPMVASWRLLTSNTRKFVHVTLKSTVAHLVQFELTEPKLECDGNTTVSDMNPKNAKDMMVASDGTTASFMWELLKDPLVKAGPMKAVFTVQYRPVDVDETSRTFTCPFDIQDCTTLFVIRTKLEPSKGSDFCRASQVCCLQLSVQRVNETEYTSLMYEVLADQTMWAVLGRTAGVISLESSAEASVTLDVMPLVAGYLPLPAVRLSKYIAQNTKDPKKDITAHPRLEPFSPGQVYHAGKAKQVHVLPSAPKEHLEPPV
ncbi:trafficking protein particle complex subunit 10 [Leguminivora glycinivorella]|uniref:trafficking protein particle complex subunit 10 n=1 Tax=Leguminivora glycinivorella TaxID=1035111 RepID=UPI00200DA493|nr:trafficking protein particle complex subunit 10 [Leguminivora glycinivorella]